MATSQSPRRADAPPDLADPVIAALNDCSNLSPGELPVAADLVIKAGYDADKIREIANHLGDRPDRILLHLGNTPEAVLKSLEYVRPDQVKVKRREVKLDYGAGISVTITKPGFWNEEVSLMMNGPDDVFVEDLSQYDLAHDWLRATRIEQVVNDQDHKIIKLVNHYADKWRQPAMVAAAD